MKKVIVLVVSGMLSTISSASFAAFYNQGTYIPKNPTPNTIPMSAAPKPSPKDEPAGELTGNFDLTTNYVFRGISQSNNLPAVQGGFTYTFTKPGIYFNLWMSNVNMTATYPDETTSTATVEIDTGVGIANDITENLSYDLSVVRYNYPKATPLNYNEVLATLAYKIFFTKWGYSTNVYNVHKPGTYGSLGIHVDVPPKYAFNFHDVAFEVSAGHYNLPRAAGLSYNDYYALLSKKINAYTLSLTWTQTNGRNQTAPLDGDHLIFTVAVDV
jgi:uncharacterized protein (TIGR02001 family)